MCCCIDILDMSNMRGLNHINGFIDFSPDNFNGELPCGRSEATHSDRGLSLDIPVDPFLTCPHHGSHRCCHYTLLCRIVPHRHLDCNRWLRHQARAYRYIRSRIQISMSVMIAFFATKTIFGTITFFHVTAFKATLTGISGFDK